MIHPLLTDIDTVDFGNAKLIKDLGDLFINYANMLGWGIGTPIAPAVRSEMLKTGRKWLKGVIGHSISYSPAEELMLFSTNDLIYRIAWNTAPDPTSAYRVVNKALEARIHGDKDVDCYHLYRLITTGLLCHFNLYNGKPLQWRTVMLDSWHDEFRTGRYFNPKSLTAHSTGALGIADSDILNRVAILIRANLGAFEQDQKSFKTRLFNNHRHYIEDLLNGRADYDADTLLALGNFINAAFAQFINQDERDAYMDAMLSTLYSKTDSPYLKASIEVRCELEKIRS